MSQNVLELLLERIVEIVSPGSMPGSEDEPLPGSDVLDSHPEAAATVIGNVDNRGPPCDDAKQANAQEHSEITPTPPYSECSTPRGRSHMRVEGEAGINDAEPSALDAASMSQPDPDRPSSDFSVTRL